MLAAYNPLITFLVIIAVAIAATAPAIIGRARGQKKE